MIAKYISLTILQGKKSLLLNLLIFLIVIKRNLLSKKIGEFKHYKNIEGLEEYNINENSFNIENKKNGISIFARIKDADEFIKEVIESYIGYIDEIVIVDNNSKDNTKKICLELKEKYPNIIKFYNYDFEIYGIGHEKWAETPENSIHSFIYYSNWCMSKTNYKYVVKLDDDVLVMDDNLIKEITTNIKIKGLNCLQIIPQININFIDGKIKTPIMGTSKIFPIIAGVYCDHGIFPISNKTYFIKDKTMESFIFPFWFKISKLGLFHLKGLKKSIGMHNQHGKMAELIKNTVKNSIYIDLPKKYLDILKNKINIKDYL
ncbi:MAG: glycosyltransferase [Candidatus Altimarinota bacterium]